MLRPLYIASDSSIGSVFASDVGGWGSILNEVILNHHVKVAFGGRNIFICLLNLCMYLFPLFLYSHSRTRGVIWDYFVTVCFLNNSAALTVSSKVALSKLLIYFVTCLCLFCVCSWNIEPNLPWRGTVYFHYFTLRNQLHSSRSRMWTKEEIKWINAKI
jgi:hypothetical protein